ncbi:MAG: 50S ribosomal protein L35 [Phycisphaerae bacterium]
MPKGKTHKGIAKRFRVTAKGKVRYRKSFSGHLMSGKSGNRRRNLRRPAFVESAAAAKIKEALGE